MSCPKDASVSENVLTQAIEYTRQAHQLSDAERLDVPAYVRKIAGPVPVQRGELAPVVWLLGGLVILALILAGVLLV